MSSLVQLVQFKKLFSLNFLIFKLLKTVKYWITYIFKDRKAIKFVYFRRKSQIDHIHLLLFICHLFFGFFSQKTSFTTNLIWDRYLKFRKLNKTKFKLPSMTWIGCIALAIQQNNIDNISSQKWLNRIKHKFYES